MISEKNIQKLHAYVKKIKCTYLINANNRNQQVFKIVCSKLLILIEIIFSFIFYGTVAHLCFVINTSLVLNVVLILGSN